MSSSSGGGDGGSNILLLSGEVKRSLHKKLSSPERRKPSPMEIKLRLREKHMQAQMNRERITQKKKSNARVPSERMERIAERMEAQRAEKQCVLEKRLEESEQRRQRQLDEIKAKAQREQQTKSL